MATRNDVVAFIKGLLSDQFRLPASYFDEADDLRAKWLFDGPSLVDLGIRISDSNWHEEYVTPAEITGCHTIKDIVDLLWKKISG